MMVSAIITEFGDGIRYTGLSVNILHTGLGGNIKYLVIFAI